MKALVLLLLPAVALGQATLGGITETNVSDTDERVLFAVKAINHYMAKKLDLVKVVNARIQLVAGTNLYLDLLLTKDYLCDVIVWERVWLHGKDRLIIPRKPTCLLLPTHHNGSAPGSISDPIALPKSGPPREALDRAACYFNDGVNCAFAHKLGNIFWVDYTEQVTAGMTYRFYNVPMVPTICRNTGCEHLDLTKCPTKEGPTINCNFVVQHHPWKPRPFSLTSMDC